MSGMCASSWKKRKESEKSECMLCVEWWVAREESLRSIRPFLTMRQIPLFQVSDL